MRTRKLSALLALASTGVFAAGCSDEPEKAAESPPAVRTVPQSAVTGPLPTGGGLLFVLHGPTAVSTSRPDPAVDAELLAGARGEIGEETAARLARMPRHRIEVEVEALEWFTDQPRRKVGIAAAAELVDNWEAYGFNRNPPNAAVSGPGTDAVVALTSPERTARGVAFESLGIRGDLPAGENSELSLFIDSSGPTCYLSIDNDGDLKTLQSSSLPHGKWVTKPPSTIYSDEWPLVEAKADGFATGCEMWVSYSGSTGTVKMHVDYPYVGDPHGSCTTTSGTLACWDMGTDDRYYYSKTYAFNG